MTAKRSPSTRLQNPRDELQRAERGLAATSSEGVREVCRRVQQAVLDSERLVVVLAVLLLYGFFFTLYHLLGMLPRNNSAAHRIPGEYWLFIGQALGILGSLALNVATYYFGSSSSGEDERKA